MSVVVDFVLQVCKSYINNIKLNIKQNWYEKPYLEGLTSFIYELLLSCGSREKKGMGRKDAPGNRFSGRWYKESIQETVIEIPSW